MPILTGMGPCASRDVEVNYKSVYPRSCSIAFHFIPSKVLVGTGILGHPVATLEVFLEVWIAKLFRFDAHQPK